MTAWEEYPMRMDKLTQKVQEALATAQELATEHGNQFLDPENLA